MLTDAEIAQYHDKGYVFPNYRLPQETLQAIRDDHDRLLSRHPEFRDNCPDLLTFDSGFLNYARDPAILDMVAQLIGPDIALWNMSFFAKPALNGKRTPGTRTGPTGRSGRWPPVPSGSPWTTPRRRTAACASSPAPTSRRIWRNTT